MIKLVYDPGGCVGCPPEWGCLGRACPQCQEYKIFCDVCGKEVDEVYRQTYCNGHVDYCGVCMLEPFTRITVDNLENFIGD